MILQNPTTTKELTTEIVQVIIREITEWTLDKLITERDLDESKSGFFFEKEYLIELEDFSCEASFEVEFTADDYKLSDIELRWHENENCEALSLSNSNKIKLQNQLKEAV
ncbi:MAG: hypothetical protein N4A45_10505 [Flavobacteriales bacterium]|jgi:hypothetical protein|nr:hypothetical protein [Flavobacteriales bacterium]